MMAGGWEDIRILQAAVRWCTAGGGDDYSEEEESVHHPHVL